MIRKTIAAAAAISLLAANAALAAAPSGGASYTLQISGFVPVICRAQLPQAATPAQAGEISLGQLSEFCNNGNGFEVWVDYSPSLAGDTLVVDGKQIKLTSAGSVRIDKSNRAAAGSKSMMLDAKSAASGSLSLRVVTL
jgi:hypothetical protein